MKSRFQYNSYEAPRFNVPQSNFTTAYKKFATEALNQAACDYLLTLFSYDWISDAVDRALEKVRPVVPQDTHHSLAANRKRACFWAIAWQ